MEALVLMAFFLSPGILAAFAKRFWPTIFASMLGFAAFFLTLAWWPVGLALWCAALVVAIRAHRVAWAEQKGS